MKKIEKKHMERETEAHSWSLEIKIEAFEIKMIVLEETMNIL